MIPADRGTTLNDLLKASADWSAVKMEPYSADRANQYDRAFALVRYCPECGVGSDTSRPEKHIISCSQRTR